MSVSWQTRSAHSGCQGLAFSLPVSSGSSTGRLSPAHGTRRLIRRTSSFHARPSPLPAPLSTGERGWRPTVRSLRPKQLIARLERADTPVAERSGFTRRKIVAMQQGIVSGKPAEKRRGTDKAVTRAFALLVATTLAIRLATFLPLAQVLMDQPWFEPAPAGAPLSWHGKALTPDGRRMAVELALTFAATFVAGATAVLLRGH